MLPPKVVVVSILLDATWPFVLHFVGVPVGQEITESLFAIVVVRGEVIEGVRPFDFQDFATAFVGLQPFKAPL